MRRDAWPLPLPTLTDTLHDAKIPHEILIVDDGSTDETAEVVAKLASTHPEVRLGEERRSAWFRKRSARGACGSSPGMR